MHWLSHCSTIWRQVIVPLPIGWGLIAFAAWLMQPVTATSRSRSRARIYLSFSTTRAVGTWGTGGVSIGSFSLGSGGWPLAVTQ